MSAHVRHMRLALALARRSYGATSPNPMVGAVLVRGRKVLGRGWHRRAGEPHAEIEALRDARRRGNSPEGATLYVTLEPCSTHGRTPPCTDAIIAAGIDRVVVGAIDPNPRHCGRAFSTLERASVVVTHGVLEQECENLNEAFNHWIVHRTPLVTVKAAMTLDGKIATASGESRWITGKEARTYGMKLRRGADAVLVGINTILADNPALALRGPWSGVGGRGEEKLRRIVLDSFARTPLDAKVVSDDRAELTTIVVSEAAPKGRVANLARRVHILIAPSAAREPEAKVRRSRRIHLPWLLKRLGAEGVTRLLVEGGGEVNASFLLPGLAHRVAFFYAPRILGGSDARKAVAGEGARRLDETLELLDPRWRRLGPDWLLTAKVAKAGATAK